MIDWNLVRRVLPLFWDGFCETLTLASLSGVTALFLGVFFALISVYGSSRCLASLIAFYTAFIRSTPLLVQLYFIHYGLPSVGIRLENFYSAWFALSLNCAAYVLEIMRGGLAAIDKGQLEAGYSIGLSKIQAISFVILPQAFKIVLPPIITQFSYLLKDSSLAALVTVPELTYYSRKMAAQYYRPLEAFGIPMLIYFALFLLLRFFNVIFCNFNKGESLRWRT